MTNLKNTSLIAQSNATTQNYKNEWEQSYERKENYVFSPHEEVIVFVSKYIRKRIGLDKFKDVSFTSSVNRILDLGCGIGRHIIYAHEMGLEPYGIDLSETAIETAKKWASQNKIVNPAEKIKQGDVRSLPWQDGFFQYALSHGVLDSMPFETARKACVELHRVLGREGLFYCDLISSTDSRQANNAAGAIIVQDIHEQGTVQQYFNQQSILALLDGLFSIIECNHIRRENCITGTYGSRYHLVLQKI